MWVEELAPGVVAITEFEQTQVRGTPHESEQDGGLVADFRL